MPALAIAHVPAAVVRPRTCTRSLTIIPPPRNPTPTRRFATMREAPVGSKREECSGRHERRAERYQTEGTCACFAMGDVFAFGAHDIPERRCDNRAHQYVPLHAIHC